MATRCLDAAPVRHSRVLGRQDCQLDEYVSSRALERPTALIITDDPNDAFWLAQTYFLTHQYARAERLLTRPFPTTAPNPPPAARGMNGHTDFKGKAKEVPIAYPANVPNVPSQTRLPVGPGEMMNVAVENQDGVSRLVDMSVACRYLAAQCQVRQGKWTEATEMLGEANPFRGSANSGPAIPNMDGGIKVRMFASSPVSCTYSM